MEICGAICLSRNIICFIPFDFLSISMVKCYQFRYMAEFSVRNPILKYLWFRSKCSSIDVVIVWQWEQECVQRRLNYYYTWSLHLVHRYYSQYSFILWRRISLEFYQNIYKILELSQVTSMVNHNSNRQIIFSYNL